MIFYPYLNDKEFLKLVDNMPYKKQYIRIFVLDFVTEEVLASIEGKATSGSINLNGSSSMRRTMSCSIVADPIGIKMQGYEQNQSYSNITEIRNLISLNKKVRAEIGFYNDVNSSKYKEYEILWFPLGTYVIKSASASKNNNGINISLTLNDKTSLLNGTAGGTFPAGIVFSEKEVFNSLGTKKEVEKILIKDIIRYIITEFGGEKPDNIIITDIPDTIVKVMKWVGKDSLYLYKEGEGKGSWQFTTIKPEFIKEEDKEKYKLKEFKYGQDVGYMNEPFVYPGKLECNAGETVSSVLDKIKNVLGNFEWFYDVYGRFVFQEVKNYLTTGKATDYLNLSANDYLSISNVVAPVYSFDEKQMTVSISTAPQYDNIKNDFVIWGTTKTAAGADKPIRYHLVFDTKPPIRPKPMLALVKNADYRGLQQVIPLTDENFVKSDGIPTNLDKEKYYYYNSGVYAWDDETNTFRKFSDWEIAYLKPGDWRTELYFQGLEKAKETFINNYYAAELNSEWPKIYDVLAEPTGEIKDGFPVCIGDYREDVIESSYEYFLDFIEGNEGLSENISQYNVNNIGRRTKVLTDNNTNCIFPNSTLQDLVIIEADGDTQVDIDLAEKKGQEVVQVYPDIFKNLTLGGSSNSAYEKAKELLLTHTQYNESVTISSIPIYYLEPNTRISIFDEELGIYGEYLIKTISLPLAVNGTSNISATKCLQKTF